MNQDVLAFAQVCAVIILSIASLGTVVTFLRRAWRRPQPQPQPRLDAARDDARLDQLQQSVEAIAVEVERIAEAQRFSARLLSERTDAKEPSR